MRPASRTDAPRAPNRIFRIASAETPVAAATSASQRPADLIQSPSRISCLLLEARRVPAVLPTARLAEALAVLVHDLIGALPGDRDAVRERLANRLFERGQLAGGTEAAALLGGVAGVLMRLE